VRCSPDSCRPPVTDGPYCLSGTMRITMAGGETFEIGPGQCGYVAPGHYAESSAPSRA
jgi:uncharacterized cupin superfamily protein